MKCVNTGDQVIHLVLPTGEVSLGKGDKAEIPTWLFKMLVTTYPELKEVSEEKLVSNPSKIQEPKVVKNETIKSDKVKKSRK